jgi:hypothetical protein
LNVVIPQPSYSSILGSNGVTIGCVISGTPSANSVAWTKIQGGQTTNVNIANSNGKYQGGSVNNPSLTILNIAQSDEANYICSATNIAGTSSSQQAFLDVTGSKYSMYFKHRLICFVFMFCVHALFSVHLLKRVIYVF